MLLLLLLLLPVSADQRLLGKDTEDNAAIALTRA